ncbi:MAG: outer membrane protein assembly factor BamD [Planctomycetales bacterium]|nr:outer membrane protein assembly factor BamD [Planctomycetales bacterium]MBN8628549.1 outer membrane protein assembly factor BamD [Planctomycetota bacterium]
MTKLNHVSFLEGYEADGGDKPRRSLLLRHVCLIACFSISLCGAIRLHAADDDARPGSATLPQAQVAVISEAGELLRSSLTAPDAAARSRVIGKARTLLEQFLAENPTHPDAPLVEMQLGVALTTEAKGLAGDATANPDEPEREKLLTKARETFLAAEGYFATAVDQLKTRYVGFPKANYDEALRRRSERLRGDLIQALMYQAGVREELAGTYPAASSEAQENYKAAADRYEQIYKDYRTLIAGLMARLKQGQCYKALGDTRRALGLYNDLLTQPDDLAALRRLRVAAMYLSLECWTSEQEHLYELAFSQGEEYLTQVRPEERSWPEWHAVRYFTARGYLLAAAGLKPAERTTEREEWLKLAAEHADRLSATPNPYQGAAIELSAEVAKRQP